MNSAASRQPRRRDTDNRQSNLRIARQLLDHVERDRLHRRPAVAPMRRPPVDLRPRNQRVEIDPVIELIVLMAEIRPRGRRAPHGPWLGCR
jgi:hypothetical protein